MPNPVWPETLFPAGMELRLQKAGGQLKSPFTGSLQACDYLGEHWEVNIQLHGEGRTRANSGLLESLLMRLSGGVNQIDVYNWRRPIPRGTLRGSPTLQGSTARGDKQLVLTVAAGSTLEPGDMIGAGIVGAGFQVFMVRSACVAVGTTLTVSIVNRVRGPIAANTAVVWDRPLLPVVMPEMGVGLSYRPGQTLPEQIRLVEFKTINSTFLSIKSPGEASLDFTGQAPTLITQWSPVFDSTLGAWWDSRDVVDGAVTSWSSRASIAQTVTQGTESAKPTKGATGVVFDGGDSLAIAPSTSPSGLNVDLWGVITLPASTGTDAIISVGDALSAATTGWGLFSSLGATDLRLVAKTGTGTQELVIGVSPSMTVPRIFYGRIDQSNDALTLWVDGTQIGTDSGVLLSGLLGNGSTLYLGNAPDTSRQPTMTLLAIGYNMGLGSQLKIEGYLAHQFGLTSQLPSDHPYKTVAP